MKKLYGDHYKSYQVIDGWNKGNIKAMMNYRFDEVYFGKVLYLEAPTVNSFYPVTKKPTEISDICVNLTIKKVRGNHATCLCKENFKEVLGAILATL